MTGARRALARIRGDRAGLVVAVAAVAWFALLAVDVWRRHDRFETFDHDLGFHSHFVWLLSRGRSFSTIVGLPAFGHNTTLGYLLFVPFAWVGLPIPHVLDIAQTAMLALGVVPIFRLARRRLDDRTWVAAAIPLLYLLHPVTQGNVPETFHPEAMAITPLLAAYDAGDEGRWGRYWLCAAAAIIWKADVALFLAVLGVVVVRRWDRRAARRTVALAAGWFVLAVALVIPWQAGGTPVWGRIYTDLGATPADAAENVVRDPARFVRQVWDGDPGEYAVDLLGPYGFVPLLAPATLVAALPQAVLNLVSDVDFTRDARVGPHYQVLPLVALTISLVEALALLHRRRPRVLDVAVVGIAACAVASTVAWGALRVSSRYEVHWTEDGDPLRAAKERAAAIVDGDDAVSAHYRFVPHLVERPVVYAFPNPWRLRSYGVGGTARPDPAEVEWLVLDLASPLDDADLEVYACIRDARTFDEVMRDGPIVVLHRNRGAPIDRSCRETR